MFVDIGSMVNLSCVVSFTEKPPDKVVWLHNEEEISFRGPRNGVSVSDCISVIIIINMMNNTKLTGFLISIIMK